MTSTRALENLLEKERNITHQEIIVHSVLYMVSNTCDSFATTTTVHCIPPLHYVVATGQSFYRYLTSTPSFIMEEAMIETSNISTISVDKYTSSTS